MAIDAFIEQIQASRLGKIDAPVLSQYEIPLVSVDIVIFTVVDRELKVLLIKRRNDPFKHSWAIPVGFIHIGENLEDAAKRRLYEETRVETRFLRQMQTFGTPGRDPRARVVTVAYYALVSGEKVKLMADSNAEDVQWFGVHHLPDLAFDHLDIIRFAQRRLQIELEDSNIAFQLLPEKFTLSRLQQVIELILNTPLDKRNFRKKIIASNLLEETGETAMDGFHRPAALYSFKEKSEYKHA